MKKESIQLLLNALVCAFLVIGSVIWAVIKVAEDRRVLLEEAGEAMRDITVDSFSGYYGFASYKVIDRLKQDATSNYAEWCQRVKKVRILDSTATDRLTNRRGAAGTYLWPLDRNAEMPVRRFTSYWGARPDPFLRRRGVGGPKMEFHAGIDMVARRGAPVYAAAAGWVCQAGRWGAYGKCVTIQHMDGSQTRYGHLDKIKVKKYDVVMEGVVIGLAGSTGRSTSPHLHWEIIIDGRPIDPLDVM